MILERSPSDVIGPPPNGPKTSALQRFCQHRGTPQNWLESLSQTHDVGCVQKCSADERRASTASEMRLAPIELRKTRIVAIIGHPGTTPLDRHGGKPGIGHPRPLCAGCQAKPREYRPMAFAGFDDLAMRLVQKTVTISKDFFERVRFLEDAGIGRDPRHGALTCLSIEFLPKPVPTFGSDALGERRHAELGVPKDKPVKPGFAGGVMLAILAEGVNEDIHIRKGHFSRPISSIS